MNPRTFGLIVFALALAGIAYAVQPQCDSVRKPEDWYIGGKRR